MIDFSVKALQFQNELQGYAAQGVLSCKKLADLNNPWKKAALVAIGIFTVGGIAASALSYSLPLAVPILVGIGGLGIVAAQVYDLYQSRIAQKGFDELHRIFSDVTAGNYQSALLRLEERSKILMGKEAKLTEIIKLKCKEYESTFKVEKPRAAEQLNFAYLYSAVSAMNALNDILVGSVKSNEQMKEVNAQLNKWGEQKQLGVLVDSINKMKMHGSKISFKTRKMQSNGALLLLQLIRSLKSELKESHFIGNDPAKWAGGFWRGDGEITMEYIRLLKIFEGQSLDKSCQEIVEAFLKCKNLKEIWYYAKGIPETALKALENKNL